MICIVGVCPIRKVVDRIAGRHHTDVWPVTKTDVIIVHWPFNRLWSVTSAKIRRIAPLDWSTRLPLLIALSQLLYVLILIWFESTSLIKILSRNCSLEQKSHATYDVIKMEPLKEVALLTTPLASPIGAKTWIPVTNAKATLAIMKTFNSASAYSVIVRRITGAENHLKQLIHSTRNVYPFVVRSWNHLCIIHIHTQNEAATLSSKVCYETILKIKRSSTILRFCSWIQNAISGDDVQRGCLIDLTYVEREECKTDVWCKTCETENCNDEGFPSIANGLKSFSALIGLIATLILAPIAFWFFFKVVYRNDFINDYWLIFENKVLINESEKETNSF